MERVPLMLSLLCLFLSNPARAIADVPHLSLAELQDAAKPDMSAATAAHIGEILSTPVVRNESANAGDVTRIGVGEFNIDKYSRGWELRSLFHNCSSFAGGDKDLKTDGCQLVGSDVILLSEADNGVCRSGYSHSTAELAEAAGFNYAEVPEFIEVEPKLTGAEKGSGLCKNVDPARARNLTENSVLSRFPIVSAAVVPLENCHDWYNDELNDGGSLFQPRELRRGRRNALIVELRLPHGDVVAVSTHLEDKTGSKCRERQLVEILKTLPENGVPVIMGGDLNTWGDSKFFNLWTKAGFDLSGNDDHVTFSAAAGLYTNRFDYLGARGLKVIGGRTLDALGNDVFLSDHTPISFQIVAPHQ